MKLQVVLLSVLCFVVLLILPVWPVEVVVDEWLLVPSGGVCKQQSYKS